ncbi:MAG TPA: ABC transporter permease [Beijerinckiaceae bacterium]|nr:ABC transporter permease [Beijerinckiaceae bacterium]
MELTTLILLTIITAATPLIIAGLGEHVVERAGVLNLGVEGMMIMGASVGFAGAVIFDNSYVGLLCGTLAGAVMAGVFAAFALGLATNQVATGLAVTIFGLGLAGLLGAPYVGQPRPVVAPIAIPLLSDLPVIGRALFKQDIVVYASFALIAGTAYVLNSTRVGLILRGVGESHGSSHALGLPVLKVRLLAVLFGGLCAGLAGAYLSLIYTRFWSPGMTAGRGWIALALVVFAAGHVWRLAAGAYLFGAILVAQLHAQAGAIGVPAQFLSMLPYLMTIIALVVLSISGRRGAGAAGSLGQPFVPDR